MRSLLLSSLLVFTAACSSGSADPAALISAGDSAMGAGDHAGALESYEAALAGLDETGPQFMRAKMGAVEAMAYAKPDACVATLKELSAGDGVSDREFNKIGGCLADAGNFKQAVEVMDLGIKAHPSSEVLLKLKDIVVAKSTAAGDSAAMEMLKGLGYL